MQLKNYWLIIAIERVLEFDKKSKSFNFNILYATYEKLRNKLYKKDFGFEGRSFSTPSIQYRAI